MLLPEIATLGETMEVNGIAHFFLTASNYERSRGFYRKLFPALHVIDLTVARKRAD